MDERRVVGSGDHEDVPGSPCASFPIKPYIDGIGLGFRLVHDGADRVFRGGSWFSSAVGARAARRYWVIPGSRSYGLGLRMVHNAEGE
jgi:formylglycine-generating enzyme required for sulfatase activity